MSGIMTLSGVTQIYGIATIENEPFVRERKQHDVGWTNSSPYSGVPCQVMSRAGNFVHYDFSAL